MIENPCGTSAPSNSIMDTGMVGEAFGKLAVAVTGKGVTVAIPDVGVEIEESVATGVEVDGWHAMSETIMDMIQ